MPCLKELKKVVSIPFISGQFVINIHTHSTDDVPECFNPLYIGSVCNIKELSQIVDNLVSIPFISGQFVMF